MPWALKEDQHIADSHKTFAEGIERLNLEAPGMLFKIGALEPGGLGLFLASVSYSICNLGQVTLHLHALVLLPIEGR